eukprot:gnl/TRDRNA2_/TRDRNA2_81574_c0_seq1.p1 gnl/TRDRNA2_/TRDRNA2_81574_c0~~gnl/TRDRNA2_/TRDRNA2_81574_c0_seq1.p1  ORF type:complete len:467 (+),score=109.91 gnl/TRDRNA2_/TRDRNA2_81574_c0_seq1:57-1457(+)
MAAEQGEPEVSTMKPMDQAAAPANRKVVIDAGAAIKMQRLERLGGALYTTGGVLAEVRDEQARALLKTLPDDTRVREPSKEDINFVKQFAKETGDLGFLSANDIELIALTVALNREAGGPALRPRPAPMEFDTGRAGFEWAPPKASGEDKKASEASPAENSTENAVEGAGEGADDEDDGGGWEAVPVRGRSASAKASAAVKAAVAAASAGGEQDTNDPFPPRQEAFASGADENVVRAEEEDADEDEDSDDGSSAGEWVTTENMGHFGLGVQVSIDVPVVCASSDYSVQNVLLQMGLTPLTFDGYAVRSVKMWGLICHACFHFSRDTTKVFCQKCGHDTCRRVPITVDQDGQATIVGHRRTLRTKGTVYSIPKTQGGRGWKPIYAEDEMKMGGRDRELRHQQNVYDKLRHARDPFDADNAANVWGKRSTTSTGKMINFTQAPTVQAGYGRRNPNANNFKRPGRGKKK